MQSKPEQERYIGTAIELMHCLSRAAMLLATLPASRRRPGLTAGMTFTMLRSVEPLLTGAAEAVLLEERFAELYEGARRTEALVPGLGGLAQQLQGARQ